jgi:hypothetical protein
MQPFLVELAASKHQSSIGISTPMPLLIIIAKSLPYLYIKVKVIDKLYVE